MTEKPVITAFAPIAQILVQQYERYLPTAFDESLTLLEKVNMVINQLNKIGELSNGVVEQWNAVMGWVMNDGLDASVETKLDEFIANGTFTNLITTIVGDLTTLTTADKTKIVNAVNEINALVSSVNSDDGYGVISGLKVKQQTVLAMAVDIEAGVVHLPNGKRVSLNSVALGVNNGDGVNPRKDIIYVSGNGVVTYLQGTADVEPVAPITPVDGVLLAEISVVVGDTTVNDVDITDKRLFKGLYNNGNTKQRIIYNTLSPVYDQLDGGVAVSQLHDIGDFQIPTDKKLYTYSVRGRNNSFGNGYMRAFDFDLTAGANATGDSVRGCIGAVYTEGDAVVKALHGTAEGLQGSTGKLVGVVGQVVPCETTTESYAYQATCGDGTSGVFIINGVYNDNTEHIEFGFRNRVDGIVFDVAFINYDTNGFGDFLRQRNLAGDTVLFSVDKDGKVTTVNSINSPTINTDKVNLSVQGSIVIPNATRDFELQAPNTGDYLRIISEGNGDIVKINADGTFELSIAQKSFKFTNGTRTYELQAVTTGDYVRILGASVGDLVKFYSNGGMVVSTATGGSMGAGTINTKGVYCDGVKILGAQQAAIADSTDAAHTEYRDKINAILAKLRAHGIIAT